ncbi:hypothetical protein [Variovorax rhizosphaerae]|uniref:Uncharacterized protein n=1 Tax=Variovorax rhizosphaerae TaxID=1836200 RepID=A0ABU8WVR9_9BURK
MQAGLLDASQQGVIEPIERWHVQATAGFGEGAIIDAAPQAALAVQGCEERIRGQDTR